AADPARGGVVAPFLPIEFLPMSKSNITYSQREQGYREKALKMFPWVCGRCGREFSGKRLSELTVHHKDHNHDNNPEDGSNWELLCLYCHDNEHSRYTDGSTSPRPPPAATGARRKPSRPSPGWRTC